MKFTMWVTNSTDDVAWKEEYDRTCTDAHAESQSIIDFFNSTLRPHEKPRRLVRVDVQDITSEGPEHIWIKTNVVTIMRSGGRSHYDAFECTKCGITGKKTALGDPVVRDRQFKAQLYDDCRESRIKRGIK